MSRTLKVLLLDKYADHLPNLSDRGITLEVTHELSWNKDVYVAPKESLAQIEKLTAMGNFDVVVVGNNLGAGVLKAMAINPRLLGRTVVVWNENVFAHRADYEKLGIRHFMTRVNLRTYVVNLVTN
jgi:hypothetical protein